MKHLIDRAEITDLLHHYCQAQDQEEWHLLETVFTPDAVIELPGTGLGQLPWTGFRDFLITTYNPNRLSGQHIVANTLFRLDGDTARTVSELISITLENAPAPEVLRRTRANSLYADDLVRTPDGWRIAHRVIAQKNIEVDEIGYAPELIATIRTTSSTRWF